MHVHILGICGTFMGSLAVLAKQLGYRVTGCDQNVYPPMSTQLENEGIELIAGFSPDQLALKPDLIVVGNIVTRGNPLMEAVLNAKVPYISGPQWLKEHVLQGKWVLAASGTHGKTTTASMLAWILEFAGFNPGYLIGGVPGNFEASARLGQSDFFVIEADEYDTAFFDKRSKFVHYQPDTLIINNLEFDHADIFEDLAAIQRQFHHLVRTVPSNGLIVHPPSEAVTETIDQGCWTPCEVLGRDWGVSEVSEGGDGFTVTNPKGELARIDWSQSGEHNRNNGLAAMAAAYHVGVPIDVAGQALSAFEGVKRRMECIAEFADCAIYDDFAHHPTAIATTLEGLRKKVGESAPIIAVIEPRSNTMVQGVHKARLAESVAAADTVYWFQPENMDWQLQSVLKDGAKVYHTVDKIIEDVAKSVKNSPKSQIVIMSNGGFQGIHKQLVSAVDRALNE